MIWPLWLTMALATRVYYVEQNPVLVVSVGERSIDQVFDGTQVYIVVTDCEEGCACVAHFRFAPNRFHETRCSVNHAEADDGMCHVYVKLKALTQYAIANELASFEPFDSNRWRFPLQEGPFCFSQAPQACQFAPEWHQADSRVYLGSQGWPTVPVPAHPTASQSDLVRWTHRMKSNIKDNGPDLAPFHAFVVFTEFDYLDVALSLKLACDSQCHCVLYVDLPPRPAPGSHLTYVAGTRFCASPMRIGVDSSDLRRSWTTSGMCHLSVDLARVLLISAASDDMLKTLQGWSCYPLPTDVHYLKLDTDLINPVGQPWSRWFQAVSLDQGPGYWREPNVVFVFEATSSVAPSLEILEEKRRSNEPISTFEYQFYFDLYRDIRPAVFQAVCTADCRDCSILIPRLDTELWWMSQCDPPDDPLPSSMLDEFGQCHLAINNFIMASIDLDAPHNRRVEGLCGPVKPLPHPESPQERSPRSPDADRAELICVTLTKEPTRLNAFTIKRLLSSSSSTHEFNTDSPRH